MFDEMDVTGDKKVYMQEFVNNKKRLNAWGANIVDPIQDFKSMDKNNSGAILFDEFVQFCLTRDL